MIENNSVKTDVLIVGGGVAGLAFSIHLADLVARHNESATRKLPINILLVEKGASLGSHSLSGAVVNPSTLKALLPGVEIKDLPFDSCNRDEFYRLRQDRDQMPFAPPLCPTREIRHFCRKDRALSGKSAEKKEFRFWGFGGRAPL